ncbi:metallophosphoesterase [Candidatus Magnetomonas plexicatena]|uniref:metallophosphoesterase n=1 Tax=Candidatus Magnetomonas plexicatena TaxID=2552947 RepID=UPI001101150E|nr:metallophosphoesterase [Nitrospirales bacterium LBB_01]
MKLFVLIYVALYSSIHYYIYGRITNALSVPVYLKAAMAVFMALMIFTPILVRFAEMYGYEHVAALDANVGYTWMGLVLIFIPVSISLEIIQLISKSELLSKILQLKIPSRTVFLLTILITLSAYIYAFIEARTIRTERLTIKTSKIPKGADKIKIAQISDVHVGVLVRESRIRPIISILKRENPDMILSTGDFVDGQLDHLNGLSNLFLELKPLSGKYAVIGNHELYAGLKDSLEFTKKSGFTILRNEAITVGFLNIAGVDDKDISRFNIVETKTEPDLLSGLPRKNFTILLKHRPIINPDSIGQFDLQLSGHTHGGQIFPYSVFPHLLFRINSGYNMLSKGSSIYLNRGAGTWGPPIRLLAPPEVTIIEIEPLE